MSHILEVQVLGVSKEPCDIFVEMTLVVLNRQHIVGVPLDDRLGDLGLAAHGVDGHDTARYLEQLQQLGDRGDLVGFVVDLDLTQAPNDWQWPRR